MEWRSFLKRDAGSSPTVEGPGGIVVFDLKSHAILGTIAAQPDADGIIYDTASKRVVVVSGDKGVMMLLKPDIDPQTNRIYLPTAEFADSVAGATGRGATKPGTFMIVVVARHGQP